MFVPHQTRTDQCYICMSASPAVIMILHCTPSVKLLKTLKQLLKFSLVFYEIWRLKTLDQLKKLKMAYWMRIVRVYCWLWFQLLPVCLSSKYFLFVCISVSCCVFCFFLSKRLYIHKAIITNLQNFLSIQVLYHQRESRHLNLEHRQSFHQEPCNCWSPFYFLIIF